MNLYVIFIGFIELVLSVLLSVFIMYLTFKFLHFLTKTIDDIKEIKSNNYSVALFNGSVLFAVAWISKASISGAISTISLLIKSPNQQILDLLKTLGIVAMQVFVSVFIAFSAVYFGLILFTKLTKKIDEFTLIKNNNISVAIIISVIIIVVALFVEPSVQTIVSGLIPYPTLIGNPS